MIAMLLVFLYDVAACFAMARALDVEERTGRDPTALAAGRIVLRGLFWPAWLVTELTQACAARMLPPGEGV